jgi:hypothetical protein
MATKPVERDWSRLVDSEPAPDVQQRPNRRGRLRGPRVEIAGPATVRLTGDRQMHSMGPSTALYVKDGEALRRAKAIIEEMGEHESELVPLLAPAVLAVPESWAAVVKELENVHVALEQLSKATVGLLAQAMLAAEHSPRRSLWRWRGVSRAGTILTAVDLAIEAARARLGPGPQPRQESERFARRLAELCARCGHRLPTGEAPKPPHTLRHVYHRLVRDAFQAYGFGAWRHHARKAARAVTKDLEKEDLIKASSDPN